MLYVGLGVDLRRNGVLIECGTECLILSDLCLKISKSGRFFLEKCDYSQLSKVLKEDHFKMFPKLWHRIDIGIKNP